MNAGSSRGATRVRLAITVAFVYAIHFAPNVVRETYLAVAIAERGTVRVDPYLGLHPDIFEIPGRGSYINSNPGASIIGAIPYALARPIIERLYAWRPGLVAPKPPATYDDPRPNRTRFMNEMRARGLDVRLGMAALVMQLGLNVPLGVLSAVVMFELLRDRLRQPRRALLLALLYAVGTPMLFRSAFLNQNLLVAHCVFLAFLAVTWRRGASVGEYLLAIPWRMWTAGLLLGAAVLCDFSAAPLLAVFAVWASVMAAEREGLMAALRAASRMGLGAAGPILLLATYQYAAFGNVLRPAQTYMPATQFSVLGWHGLTWPSGVLLWRNLFDPAYGLFAFCPMLLAALIPRQWIRPGTSGRGTEVVSTRDMRLIAAACGALYVFSSSVSFAALQWNTGVRYLVPAVPLLFLALIPMLEALPRSVSWTLAASSLALSWMLSMTRESVPVAMARILRNGPELPWNTVLMKTADAYLPALPRAGLPLVVYGLLAVVLWTLWRHDELLARVTRQAAQSGA